MIEIARRKRRPPNVSIAALVDCVFLLLIFFLLTSTYSSRRGLKIELPGASTAEAAEKRRIEVEIASDDSLAVDSVAVSREGVEGALRAAAANRKVRTVLLVADRRASVDALTFATDAARRAGLGHLTIATRRHDSEGRDSR